MNDQPKYNDERDEDGWVYVCPSCGYEDDPDRFGKHCPRCGEELED